MPCWKLLDGHALHCDDNLQKKHELNMVLFPDDHLHEICLVYVGTTLQCNLANQDDSFNQYIISKTKSTKGKKILPSPALQTYIVHAHCTMMTTLWRLMMKSGSLEMVWSPPPFDTITVSRRQPDQIHLPGQGCQIVVGGMFGGVKV